MGTNPMKIPLNWLREYVDIAIPPAQLIERLTLAGLEVSGTRVYGLPVPDGVRVKAEEAGPEWHRDKIVTAKVLKVCGRTVQGADVSAGSYTNTVTITVNYL